MADADGDGIVDVAAAGIIALPSIFRGNGTLIGTVSNANYGENSNSDDIPSLMAISNGTFGDIDNNGQIDLIWGGAGLGFAEAFASAGTRVDFDHHVSAWDTKTLAFLPGFPQRADDHQFFMNPSIADVSGDNYPEILSGSGGYYLRAWDYTGKQPEGWPKFTGGWVISSPAVGDLDGNGKLEVVTANREGYLYAWNTEGSTQGRVDWASFHHDDRNTGNYENSIGFGIGPEEIPPETNSCGCRSSTEHPAMLLYLLLAWICIRPRRQKGVDC